MMRWREGNDGMMSPYGNQERDKRFAVAYDTIRIRWEL